MDKKKTSRQLLEELKTLLDVRKNLIGVDKINGVIADKAEEFVKTLYTEIDDEVKKTFEPSVVPKKSEMPCNCRQEKTLPEFAAKTASCVFEVPKYKEEVVPAILVPLQEALDEAKAQSTGKQNYVDMVFRVGETGAR